jgi:hypothetical protein
MLIGVLLLLLPVSAPWAQTSSDAEPPGVHLGLGDGFRITTPASGLDFGVRARMQLRSTTRAPDAPDGIWLQSTEIRRASIFLDGTVGDPRVRFFLQGILTPRELAAECAAAGDDGSCRTPIQHGPVFDAFVTWHMSRGLALRAGLFKPFFTRQFIAPWGALAFVDRGIAEGEFRVERDLGVDLHAVDIAGLDRLTAHLSLFGGHGRDNVQLQEPSPLVVARLTWMPQGIFLYDQEADLRADSRRIQTQWGTAVARQWHALRAQGPGGQPLAEGVTAGLTSWTVDGVARYRGVSLEGAWTLRRMQARSEAPVDTEPPALSMREGEGWHVQCTAPLGLRDLQGGLRAGGVTARPGSAIRARHEEGAGVSWYVRGHDLKVQLDYTRIRFATSAPDPAIHEVRLQMQATL